MSTGWEGFGKELMSGVIREEVHGLRQAVDEGKLVMDPDAAERVAKVYEGKADDVYDLIRDTERMVTHNAYGDCQIGRQLEQKFNEKVNGTGGEAKDGVGPILRETEKILREMAQAYRDSAKDMQNTDDENARDLGRNT